MVFVIQPHAIAREIVRYGMCMLPILRPAPRPVSDSLTSDSAGSGVLHTYGTYLDQIGWGTRYLTYWLGLVKHHWASPRAVQFSSAPLCAVSQVAAYSVLLPVGTGWLRLGAAPTH